MDREFGIVPVKYKNKAAAGGEERVKERWSERFKNLVNQDRIAGKDIEKIKFVTPWTRRKIYFMRKN